MFISRLSSAIFLFVISTPLFAQKISSRLKMEQGAEYEVTTEVKNLLAQQANGMSFDFNTEGTAAHTYSVTNITEENITLRHKMKRLKFSFDGMGSKRSFDSDVKKDLDNEFGRPVRDMLTKSYDMIIDSLGKTLLVLAPTAAPSQGDDQYRLISGLLGDLATIATPPQKGDPTLFMVWPGGEMAPGESWTITKNGEKEKYSTQYVLKTVTDSTFIIDFVGNGTVKIDNEMRGMQIVMNLKNVTTGQMTVDRNTGIIREKTSTVESSGTSEMMGGSTPVSGKSTITIRVRKVMVNG